MASPVLFLVVQPPDDHGIQNRLKAVTGVRESILDPGRDLGVYLAGKQPSASSRSFSGT